MRGGERGEGQRGSVSFYYSWKWIQTLTRSISWINQVFGESHLRGNWYLIAKADWEEAMEALSQWKWSKISVCMLPFSRSCWLVFYDVLKPFFIMNFYGGPEVQVKTTFQQKTLQHFRKHYSISENATAFQKTLQHFRKHYSISQNATAFQLLQKGYSFRENISCLWLDRASQRSTAVIGCFCCQSRNDTSWLAAPDRSTCPKTSAVSTQHFVKCWSVFWNAVAFCEMLKCFLKCCSVFWNAVLTYTSGPPYILDQIINILGQIRS